MQHTYLRIAQFLENQIEAGRLAPGEKLPSVRSLALSQGVSVSTVTRGYRQLEASGHVVARFKSGMYVADWSSTKAARPKHANSSALSAPLELQKFASLQDRLTQLHTLTEQPLRFALHLATADTRWYPNEALARIGQRLLRTQPQLMGAYPSGTGLPALKHELIRHLLSSGIDLSAEEILITQGSTEAMHLALRAVTQPGDTVIVESPVYFGLLQLIETLGLRALEIPSGMHGKGISLETLEYALEHTSSVKAIILMPCFQNPLGTIMSANDKRKLMKIVARYPDITLIEDDTFGDLCTTFERPQALKAWDKLRQIIYCGSASKSMAPGLRIGWIAAGRHQARIHALKLASSLSTPLFEQHVLAEYLKSNAFRAHLRVLHQRLKTCIRPAQEAVKKYFPRGTKITCPDGGWWLWLELPETCDTMALLKNSIARGISFAPGILFSGSNKFQHCLRLNIGRPWNHDMEMCLQTIGELASTHSTSFRP